MQFFTLTLAIATLFSATRCAPTEPTNQPELPVGSIQIAKGLWYSNTTTIASNDTDPARSTSESVNVCGQSTFENRVTEASPLAKDCLSLRDNIAGEGRWTVDVFTQHQLVEYKTCAFGVSANGGRGGSRTTFYVGNDDIRELIARSVSDFQWKDNVGTRGFMACQPDELQIEWGIYHNQGVGK